MSAKTPKFYVSGVGGARASSRVWRQGAGRQHVWLHGAGMRSWRVSLRVCVCASAWGGKPRSHGYTVAAHVCMRT